MIRRLSIVGIGLSVLLSTFLSAQTSANITFAPDVPEGSKVQMRDDFAFLSSLKGSGTSEFYAQIFGGRTLQGADLVAFFTTRIATVGLRNCGIGPAVACVIPMIDSHTMWLTPVFQTINVPQLLRVSILLHEARHSEDENENWMHAKCPVPFRDEFGRDNVSIFSGAKLEGLPGCDVTPFGAYGSQIVLFRNIEKTCLNCNQKLRMDAKLFGDDQFKRITNPAAKRSLQDDANAIH